LLPPSLAASARGERTQATKPVVIANHVRRLIGFVTGLIPRENPGVELFQRTG
jgi:hypothetical protein